MSGEALLKRGLQLTGAVAGGAVELFTGGAFAGLAGAATSELVTRTIEDWSDKWLSERERTRSGAAAVYALNRMVERINRGDRIREDGYFFDYNENYQAPCQEILEGVLTKCKNENEERKIKHMAYLFSSVAFEPGMTAEEAHLHIKTAEKLTFAQLVLLQLYAEKTRYGFRGNEKPVYEPEEKAILQELFVLKSYGLIQPYYANIGVMGRPGMSEERSAELNYWNQLTPDSMYIAYTGKRLAKLMELGEIGVDERQRYLRWLT